MTEKSTHQLNILFIPIDAVGHINSCLSLAEVLTRAGHRVSFAVNEQWRDKLGVYGVRELLLVDENRPDNSGKDAAREFAEMCVRQGVIKRETSPLEGFRNIFMNSLPEVGKRTEVLDREIGKLLADKLNRPDVIFVEQAFCLPSVVQSGIPWIYVGTCNPIAYIDDDRTPPANSGLSSKGSYDEWTAFRDETLKVKQIVFKDYNKYLLSKGVSDFQPNHCLYFSKYLNIYGYPRELDYLDMRPLPDKWFRFDNFMRSDRHLSFKLPEQLLDKPGKLIYFSLGTMGAIDFDNMNRLTGILAKSQHRFIVSLGPLPEKIQLADNMWGQSSVSQIQVLPLVDLVITHGGNNTISETFSYGKPMIVMPLFGDQYDNAQRVEDTGFGRRLDVYKCSEQELLTAIDSLLNDKLLVDRLQQISKRILTDNSLAKLPEIVEQLVKSHK
ncbi:NDP-glycosyltransferase YjiC-like [Oppia nitens]|uniref:NDP-glycosyltransferase YjiC-like n=1 Tax=Oppia nitens TaxID=1686743 RepID=UPI0023DB5569|nr:NDP-glycosyltransferase YjiC-like [Oppia nitens]